MTRTTSRRSRPQPAGRLLLDWHVPDFGEPVRIDAAAYLAAVDRMKPDAVYLMAKSAFGCTYYDDALGRRNAALEQDLLADLVAPLRERGIEVLAYFNVTLNDVIGAEHPEWHQVSPDGRPVIAFTYRQMCMNSDYREQVFRMLEDIARKYAVDGFWFDLAYMHSFGCFCAACRREFEREHGFALTPEIGADPARNARFHAFRRATRARFLGDAMRRVSAVRPGMRFGWNHAGDLLFSEGELDAQADLSSIEFHPPFFLRGGIAARHLRTLGRPFELMLPETLGGWGDWTVMTPETMRTMAGIAAAHGGSVNVGHVPYPSGDLAGMMASPVVETISETFRLLGERRSLCGEARSVPVAACLHSVEAWRAAQASDGLHQRPHLEAGFAGGMELLAENNVHFDVLTERQLDGLDRYELLVLSETEYLSPATAEAVRHYVSQGGTVVALGAVGTTDDLGRGRSEFELSEVLGVSRVGESPFSVSYLDALDARLSPGLPPMPLLVKAAPPHETLGRRRSLRCRAHPGAEVWARFTDPAFEPDVDAGRHIYHMHCPPARRTEWPAVVRRTLGAGQTFYVAAPVAYAFGYSGSPWLRRFFANLLGAAGRPQRLRVEGPPGLEVALMEQAGVWRLHLVPRHTETLGSAQRAEALWVHGVRVSVRRPGLRRVTLHPDGSALPFERSGDAVLFDLPPFRDWRIVSIE